jgi:hypothetical protein
MPAVPAGTVRPRRWKPNDLRLREEVKQMSEFNAIEALSAAGIPVTDASDEERAVFASLSESEVAVLTGLKTRLASASGDVEAHLNDNGGNAW